MKVALPEFPSWYVNLLGTLLVSGVLGWLWLLKFDDAGRQRLRKDIAWLQWRPLPANFWKVFLLLLGAGMVLQSLGFSILVAFLGPQGVHTLVQHLVGITSMHVLITAGIVRHSRRERIPLAEVPALSAGGGGKAAVAGGVAYVLALPLVTLSVVLTQALFPIFDLPINPQDIMLTLPAYDRPWMWGALVFMVVFLGPFCEEVVFRGYVLPWCTQHLGFGLGLVVHSLFFAAIHMNAAAMLPLFALSCVLGLVYIHQKNLLAAFWLHAVFNGMTLAGFFLGNGGLAP